MKIHGYAAKTAGGKLVPFEYEAPGMGETDVLVEISHCGLCYTDLHYIDDGFGKTPYPFVPGHEIVGTVAAKGGAVRTLEKGQRGGIGFQRNSCGHCEWCVRGEENLCPDVMPNATSFPTADLQVRSS